MVSTTSFHPRPSNEKTKLWNPTKTLGIINTDPGYQCITCVGHAPSKGRRCRIGLSGYNKDFITNTLDEISYLSPSDPAVLKRLRSIAAAGLCVRFHQGQVEGVVREWQRMMQRVDVEKVRPVEKVTRGAQRVSELDVKDLERQLEEMRELLERVRDEKRRQGLDTEKDEQAQRKKRAERERAERERIEKERLEKERVEKERVAKERLEKERAEKERLEKEQREKAEAKKREQEKNERIRQQAQKRREEAERAKREAERKAEQEWEEAWVKYQEGWVCFRNSTSWDGDLHAVPWPVKSGAYKDVKASSVREFLESAMKRDERPERLLRMECRKWHPDTSGSWLRGTRVTVVDRMMIDMICKVVTGLVDKSAGRKSDLFA